MKNSDYIREVTSHCCDLRISHRPFQHNETVVNKVGIVVIGPFGNCNVHGWNRGWVPKNIKEFNGVDREVVDVKELFPNPKDFVKFYEKVCKEIENEIFTT